MKTIDLNILAHYGLMAILATLAMYGVDVCLAEHSTFQGYIGASIPAVMAILAYGLGRFQRGE